ncbi:MAG TPA: hypothetical protein DET40_24170 [Lentisphaeria bacterium]|nr:MAG: hypothetical protein A2X45_08895 [Lentisphaerae bacterium GWF2_50_93]HCE46656.1 hypothetical protein [Lentisphaeria bacterium]
MLHLSRTAVLILFTAFSFSAAVAAEDKASVLLKKAWLEYRFQEVKKARSYFEEAEKKASDKDEMLQALTGQAFCFQFLMKNSVTSDDYGKAVILYDRCLKEAGTDHKYLQFWKSMKAECLYRISVRESDTGKAGKAEELWTEVQQDGAGTVFAQDAMLSRAIMQSDDVNDARVTSHCADMDKYLVPFRKDARKIDVAKDRNAMLAPVMATYLYNVYFFRGDFKKSVDSLIDYCKFGPTSFQYKATAYFKVARISETRLSDNKTAVDYYMKFYNECGSDSRSYYSLERAKTLGASGTAGNQPAKAKEEKR